jgi:hypothetical protein
MNLSEQIQGKLKAISELEVLLYPLLLERDKEGTLSILSEVQERLKELKGKIEKLLQAKENDHDIIQKALRYVECDPSPRGNKLDDEALQDKFVSSSPQDELHRDTSVAGISSQASTEVFYIRYQDHKSTEGCYVSKPDDGDTRFQITVSQSNPHVGILQFRDGLDEITKAEIMGSRSYPLIRKESSWGGEGRSQGTHEDGEVGLDPELKRWRLITPIKIK